MFVRYLKNQKKNTCALRGHSVYILWFQNHYKFFFKRRMVNISSSRHRISPIFSPNRRRRRSPEFRNGNQPFARLRKMPITMINTKTRTCYKKKPLKANCCPSRAHIMCYKLQHTQKKPRSDDPKRKKKNTQHNTTSISIYDGKCIMIKWLRYDQLVWLSCNQPQRMGMNFYMNFMYEITLGLALERKR